MESSEKILLIRSLIKEDINFWDKDIQVKKSISQDFLKYIADKDVEPSSLILKEVSKKVAYNYNYIISGYSAKKID